MKMASGGIKGLGALVVVWLTYINNTLSPLFWVFLALVAMDLFLSAHKEGQQFAKDPKQNAITQDELAALVVKAMAAEKARAEQVIQEVQKPKEDTPSQNP